MGPEPRGSCRLARRWRNSANHSSRAGEDDGNDEPPGSPGDADAGPLDGELAAIDRALTRSTRVLAGGATRVALLRNPLIYDPDAEEGEKLEAWRRAAAGVQSESPVLAAAFLWDAWESDPPLARAGLARPAAGFGHAAARQKTRAHLACVNLGLRCVPREKRRSPDQAASLPHFWRRSWQGRGQG